MDTDESDDDVDESWMKTCREIREDIDKSDNLDKDAFHFPLSRAKFKRTEN